MGLRVGLVREKRKPEASLGAAATWLHAQIPQSKLPDRINPTAPPPHRRNDETMPYKARHLLARCLNWFMTFSDTRRYFLVWYL